MTIKKRLMVSNIIMTAVPIIISGIIAVLCLLIYYTVAHSYLPELNDIFWQLHIKLESSEEVYSAMNIVKWAIFIAIPLVIVLTSFYTNRFLTRFITNKILNPLEKIAYGIGQIQDGNLDYRIEYDNDDEFTKVCDALNIMSIWLKESNAVAQKEELSRKETFAGMSHDLRSPLTSIRAYTQALIDGVPQTQESIDFHLKTIMKKELVIESMVNQIFLYAKMDLNDFPFSPDKMVIAEELKMIAEENQMENLETTVTGDDDIVIFADHDQIQRIMVNIMGNAKKYCGRQNAKLAISVKKDGDNAIIEFNDNGNGVPEENLPKLFDTFFRGDAARQHPDKGSGLGLSIVKKAVDQMNGTVRAENRNGLCIIITVSAFNESEDILK